MKSLSSFVILLLTFVVASVLLNSIAVGVNASILKDVMPKAYTDNEPLPVVASPLTSSVKILPMPWYSLPWCQISKQDRKDSRRARNFGERLWGQATEITLYRLDMRQNVTCAKVCDFEKSLTDEESKKLNKYIEDQYRGQLMLDNLPVAEAGTSKRNRFRPSALRGFPLGVSSKLAPGGKAMVNNHLAFHVQIAPNTIAIDDEDKLQWRIVGFSVSPLSIDHSLSKCDDKSDVFEAAANHPQYASNKDILWTYSVLFEETNDIEWTTRWDVYMQTSKVENKAHLVSLVNSTLVVILLSAIVAIILIRALKKDIATFNDREEMEEELAESGWKHLHQDIARPPQNPTLLAVLVGSGMQLFALATLTIIFAIIGFVSPKRRGSLLTAFVFLFVLLGSVGGYVTGLLAKQFKLKSWGIIAKVGLFFPGSLFIMYFLLNFVHWGAKASSATPFTTMLLLMVLWFCVSLPLVFIGGAAAYRNEYIETLLDKKVTPVPRMVPEQPAYMSWYVMFLLPGVLPFGASLIEYSFVLGSVWQGYIYYVFGFLFVAFLLVIVIVAETSIFLTYVRLVRMDHNWWWPAWLIGASYGIWIFLYGAYYFVKILTIRNVWSVILYFGYNFMISYTCAIMTGAVGFVAAELFVGVIFRSLRLD